MDIIFSFLLGIYLELLTLRWLCVSLFEDLPNFSTADVSGDSPTSNVCVFQFLHILANICHCHYVYSHPSEYSMDLVKRQGQGYLSNANLLLGGPPDIQKPLVHYFSVVPAGCL